MPQDPNSFPATGTNVSSPGHEPAVAIVLVNLNGYQDTRECLWSLQRLEYPNVEVIVVDNGSTDDSVLRLRQNFPWVYLIESPSNLGFSGGNNLGIEAALKKGAAYVFLLNNDTIADPNLVTRLVAVGESDATVGILGGKIFYAYDPDRIWYAGGEVISILGICRHLGLNRIDAPRRFTRVGKTQFVTGCAMMIKARVFHAIGMLDTDLFMYWEDADFCMRAQRAGFNCMFVPSAQLWHKISKTTGARSPLTTFLSTRNQLVWISRYLPYPGKATALGFTLLRKILQLPRLALGKDELARATWGGILAYFEGSFGPPKNWTVAARSAQMSAD